MSAALNTASAANAYVISDRGTWLSFNNKGELVITVEGDKPVQPIRLMLVNPQKHPHVRMELGQQFFERLISPEGQRAIADCEIGGELLFYPKLPILPRKVKRPLPRRWRGRRYAADAVAGGKRRSA